MKGASGGDVGRVDQLLASEACGVDDKFNGRTALHAASQNGHYDVVRCLIRYTANIEEEVYSVLCTTVYNDSSRLSLTWMGP